MNILNIMDLTSTGLATMKQPPFHLHCLNKHIEELLPVVKELLTDSVLPEEELAIYQQNMKQRLKVNLKKSDFVAGGLSMFIYMVNSIRMASTAGKKILISSTRQQLLDFYKKYYQQGKLVMFVAGKLPCKPGAAC